MLGFIPDTDLPTYYQAADLFVLPTLALEGFGLVTTEALSSGLPVIGTPAGATPEILGHLDPRLIAPGTTPDDLAKAILGFFEGDWAGSLTPERLHAYVAEHYTWDKHIIATEAVYEKARAAEASKESRAFGWLRTHDAGRLSIGPSVQAACTISALPAPLAISRISRASRIVPIPIETA